MPTTKHIVKKPKTKISKRTADEYKLTEGEKAYIYGYSKTMSKDLNLPFEKVEKVVDLMEHFYKCSMVGYPKQ